MRGFGPQGRVPVRSDFVNSCLLTTTAQAFDIPAGARFVSFGADANFAAAFGSTGAVYPSATSTASSSAQAEINPLTRDLQSSASTTGYSLVGKTAGGLVTMTYWSQGG